MAYDEMLAARIRTAMTGEDNLVEKQMFGGIAFLLNGNMTCGVVGEKMVARVGPDQYDTALENRFAHPMDFTGRPMRGRVFVAPEGIQREAELHTWIELARNYVSTLPPK